MAKTKVENVNFVKRGMQIIVPEKMTYAEAMAALQRKKEEEETVVNLHEEIQCFPLDGAYALMNVLKERYGWATAVPTPGFFGPQAPTMVDFEIDFEKYTPVVWGSFDIPGVEGRLQTSADHSDDGLVFVISGKVMRKYESQCREIADDVRKWIKEKSVYKNKAIKLRTDSDGDLDSDTPPKFLDLSQVNEQELVFTSQTAVEVRTSLFTPIEQTEACRKARIPLKRGILFEGPYGVGKTLTAYVTAKKCVQSGWTFIYLDRVGALDEALRFARLYMPAVIFAEDIDRAVSGDERTVELDDVLNSIDGIEAKNSEIMVVLTTNHVEKINRAMLRPGRLDAVISVTPPDAEAAEKLIRLYARDLLPNEVDVSSAAKTLAGSIPAVIREVVERSKLYAISRTGSNDFTLSSEDIEYAGLSMQRHLTLLSGPKEHMQTIEESFGQAMKGLMKHSINGHEKMIEETHRGVTHIVKRIS
jgi:transitional endoplasmic reticulum ATPase